MNLSLSTSLNPKVFEGKSIAEEEEYVNRLLAFNPDLYYIDYSIPWDIRFSYTYNLRRFELRQTKEEARVATQSFSVNGNVSFTPKWKFTYGANYDFESKKFVTPRIGASRDLNCWEMRMDWVPFGSFTQYNFYINIKSAMLKDILKYKRKNDFRDSINN